MMDRDPYYTKKEAARRNYAGVIFASLAVFVDLLGILQLFGVKL